MSQATWPQASQALQIGKWFLIGCKNFEFYVISLTLFLIFFMILPSAY